MTTNLHALLRGDREEMFRFLAEPNWKYLGPSLVTILIGSGLYGARVGLWRSPEQALYTAIKIPALVLLTCAGNAVRNGMLASCSAGACHYARLRPRFC